MLLIDTNVLLDIATRDARDLDLKPVPPSDFRRLPLPYSCAFATARAFQA